MQLQLKREHRVQQLIWGMHSLVGWIQGYAKSGQEAAGIHTRLYSRAFVFASAPQHKRLVYVSIDACMTSQVVTLKVVEKLKR